MVVKASLSQTRPDVVKEIHRLVLESKRAAGLPAAGRRDPLPCGIEALRKPLAVIIEYAVQQRLIPRPLAVDELFDDTTRVLPAG
jgi:4,5-dihydroxyphthalate decarboxylase